MVFRRVISTFFSRSSSDAVPENVIGEPGLATTVGTANGGVIDTGWLMLTVGATAFELT